MKLFKLLFDSYWRERGDPRVRERYTQQHESMAEQVMANRNEIAYLHVELNRLSQDLAQAMLLNRALVKVLVEQGSATPVELEEALSSILAERQVAPNSDAPPSRFCEECGRPLPEPGGKCPYCSEIDVEVGQGITGVKGARKRLGARTGPRVPWTKHVRGF